MKIKFGVLDTPRFDGVSNRKVAHFLEQKYQLIGRFVNSEREFIVASLQKNITRAIKTQQFNAAAIGSLTGLKPKWLDYINTAQHGITVKRAVKGYSARFKRKQTKTRGPRTAFVDTGIYRGSFFTWVER